MARTKRLEYGLNEAGYFLCHRLLVARAARANGFELHVAPQDEAFEYGNGYYKLTQIYGLRWTIDGFAG